MVINFGVTLVITAVTSPPPASVEGTGRTLALPQRGLE